MPIPDTIQKLIQRFEHNQAAYRLGDYKEASLRLEFLDPFFDALGWDIANKQGYPETFKEVIVEQSIKVGG